MPHFKVNQKVIRDPRNVLHYLAHRGLSRTLKNPKEIVKEARLWLDDDDYMWGTELWEESKKWPKLSEKKLEELVRKAQMKKYSTRKSPRFSAAELCGVTLPGNDKKMYDSVKQGKTCAWKLSLTK